MRRGDSRKQKGLDRQARKMIPREQVKKPALDVPSPGKILPVK
jgi:hypothetical protein